MSSLIPVTRTPDPYASNNLGLVSSLPIDIRKLLFSFFDVECLGKASKLNKDFSVICKGILSDERFYPSKIEKFFKIFQKKLKVENRPLPPIGKDNLNAFALGLCPKNGGFVILQKGHEKSLPRGWMTGEHWQELSGYRDKEISEGDKHYSFFVNDRDSKLSIVDKLTGCRICEIDPFDGLSKAEERKRGIIGVHSLNKGSEIIILAKNGMFRKWKIDPKDGSPSTSGSPLNIFKDYYGPFPMDGERSWLIGNSLFVEVPTRRTPLVSKEIGCGKNTLLQFDIRSDNLVCILDLIAPIRIAVNNTTLFIASLGSIFLPGTLQAYGIDPETLKLNKLWSFPITNMVRLPHSQTLAVNDKWVMEALEAKTGVTILDASTGNIFWELETNLTSFFDLDAHLFDDLVVFEDKTKEKDRCCIAHIPLKEKAYGDIPLSEWKEVRHPNGKRDGIKFKIDFKNMKIYGLMTKENMQSLIEISKGDEKSENIEKK